MNYALLLTLICATGTMQASQEHPDKDKKIHENRSYLIQSGDSFCAPTENAALEIAEQRKIVFVELTKIGCIKHSDCFCFTPYIVLAQSISSNAPCGYSSIAQSRQAQKKP